MEFSQSGAQRSGEAHASVTERVEFLGQFELVVAHEVNVDDHHERLARSESFQAAPRSGVRND